MCDSALQRCCELADRQMRAAHDWGRAVAHWRTLGSDPDALSADESMFMDGYGAADIDALALAYYRYEWCVQDIGSFGETILLTPATGDDTKRESIYYFTLSFAPGERIEAADRLAAKLAL